MMRVMVLCVVLAGCESGSSTPDTGGSPDSGACPPAACTAAQTESECGAQGGRWEPFGLAHTPMCVCDTREAQCACQGAADCLGDCLAPVGPGGISDCSGITIGRCVDTMPWTGCQCLLLKAGSVVSQCRD